LNCDNVCFFSLYALSVVKNIGKKVLGVEIELEKALSIGSPSLDMVSIIPELKSSIKF